LPPSRLAVAVWLFGCLTTFRGLACDERTAILMDAIEWQGRVVTGGSLSPHSLSLSLFLSLLSSPMLARSVPGRR